MAYTKRYNVTTKRPKSTGNDEVWWHRIGKAFTNEKGQITVYLDSLPIPGSDGKVQLYLFEDTEERQERVEVPVSLKEHYERQYINPPTRSIKNDLDDDIPF